MRCVVCVVCMVCVRCDMWYVCVCVCVQHETEDERVKDILSAYIPDCRTPTNTLTSTYTSH